MCMFFQADIWNESHCKNQARKIERFYLITIYKEKHECTLWMCMKTSHFRKRHRLNYSTWWSKNYMSNKNMSFRPNLSKPGLQSMSETVNGACVQTCACMPTFGLSLEANDLLSGQSDELVKIKLDVLPPVASVPAVGLSRITRTPWNRDWFSLPAYASPSMKHICWSTSDNWTWCQAQVLEIYTGYNNKLTPDRKRRSSNSYYRLNCKLQSSSLEPPE